MYYECCVCKRSRQNAILYHFPCSKKRRNEWLQCLNRDDLKELSQENLSKLFVCQNHFEKRFLTTKSRLTGDAFPSLFTEEEIITAERPAMAPPPTRREPTPKQKTPATTTPTPSTSTQPLDSRRAPYAAAVAGREQTMWDPKLH
ncbi:hypothetical protein ACJJTC_014965 [Scirpophaga incertulas]